MERKLGAKMSIGERISQLRKAQNISQGQLAQALEVSRQAVSKWENDQMIPDSLKLIRLADILDTDIEYLTTGRRNYGRRPPVIIKEVETVEKIVEKPVEMEKIVEVEKIIEVEKVVERIVEKPVIRQKIRTRYVRNPLEYLLVGAACFVLGLIVGLLL